MVLNNLLIINNYLVFSSMVMHGIISSAEARALQQNQTANYLSTHKVDFQHVKDPLCSYDLKPTVVSIACGALGTEYAKLTIIDLSDARINCTAVTEYNSTCTLNCVDDECDSLYVSTNTSSYFDGQFASITFTCENDDPIYLSGTFVYDTNDVTCFSNNGTQSTRTFHAARLGVSCLVGSSREYVYDDTYLECSLDPAINIGETGNDVYICASGYDCEGFGCEKTITTITLASNVGYFFDKCVDKPDDVVIIGYPTMAPVVSPFVQSAKFEALWSVMYDSSVVDDSGCIIEQRGAAIKCTNDASIRFIQSSDPLMSCTPVNNNELHCISSDESIQNEFVSVEYNCTGPRVPTSDVTFLQSVAACSFPQIAFNISHTVAMGIKCDVGTFHLDAYTECGNISHQFGAGRSGFDVFPYNFLTCSESVYFEISTLNKEQVIPNVTIQTDVFWLLAQYPGCLSRVSAPAPTTNPVSQAPTTKAETILPTIAPSPKPISFITSAPITTSENLTPSGEPVQSLDSNNGVESGAIIGGVIGGLAAIVIIALLAFKLNQKTHTASTTLVKPNVFVADATHPSESENIDTSISPPFSIPPPSNIPHQSNQVATTQSTIGNVATSAGYMPDYKDQSRSVVQPNHINNISGNNIPLPVYRNHQVIAKVVNHAIAANAEAVDHNNIPVAVAYGVSTTVASSATGDSTTTNKSKEPPGRVIVDI